MRRLLTFLVGLLLASAAVAQSYPSRPIRIVVPAAAGGPADQLLRALAIPISEDLKVPVVIENKPGASGIIAAEYTMRAAPDGYTVLMTTEAVLTMLPHMYKKLPYDAKTSFMPVTQLVDVPMVLVVGKNVPANSLKEFIAHAAKNPGKVSFGTDGQGSVVHLPMAVLENDNKIKLNNIPYKGSAPIIPDMLAGSVDSTLVGIALVEQHLQSGNMRALAVSSPTRVSVLPDVPTFEQAGVKDIAGHFIMGLVTPAGTPASVNETLAASARRALNNPAFRAKYVDPFAYRVVASSPKEFDEYLKKDYEYQRERVRLAGVSMIF